MIREGCLEEVIIIKESLKICMQRQKDPPGRWVSGSKGLEVRSNILYVGSQKQFSVAGGQNVRQEEASLLTGYVC